MSELMQETPDRYGAYPRLSAEQIDALASRGRRRTTGTGDILFHEGDPSYDFHVILSGAVALIEGYGTPAEREISVHGPGRFLGELSLLAGQPALPWQCIGPRTAAGAEPALSRAGPGAAAAASSAADVCGAWCGQRGPAPSQKSGSRRRCSLPAAGLLRPCCCHRAFSRAAFLFVFLS